MTEGFKPGEEKQEKTGEKPFPKNVMLFDPMNPPYQVQHLCICLRELEEETVAEEEREGGSAEGSGR